MFKDFIQQTNKSIYKISKESGIPYSTLNELVLGKKNLKDCSVKLLNTLAGYFGVSMDRILSEANGTSSAGSGTGQKNDYISKYRLPSPSEWKICIDKPFENCNRIHPLQQHKVRQLIDDISSSEGVSRIVVFGSSATNRCHIGSDVDVYVEMKEELSPVKGTYGFDVDLWNNFMVDERLKNEIERTGVVVYEC